MINNTRFTLTSKLNGNIAAVFITLPNGNTMDIAWFKFPNDHQVNDDLEAINSIIPIIRRRIRKSLS